MGFNGGDAQTHMVMDAVSTTTPVMYVTSPSSAFFFERIVRRFLSALYERSRRRNDSTRSSRSARSVRTPLFDGVRLR